MKNKNKTPIFQEMDQGVNNFFDAVDDMFTYSRIDVKGFGPIKVTFVRDEAGNLRMKPLVGAVDLEKWRKDPELLPPWILPDDCVDPEEWNKIFHRAFRAITLAEAKLNEEA